ncbi:MAG: hypothetical protein RLZZ387_2123 [Chloroflexota bacterium]|jgi:aspartyl-tRNA(Asn)/glutamyl-tRNA(Gln) amidotransferase subunit A
MALSPTRQGFRDSVTLLRALDADAPETRPAFTTPLAGQGRPALPDLPAPRLAPTRPWPTIAEAQRLMAQGELTAVALVEAALEAVAARQEELNAFVCVAPAEELLREARLLDDERRRGRVRGPLHGVTVSVKDVIAVAGMCNTASSRMLEGNVARDDAESVRRLREAGAVIVGKTQTHEFALGVVTPQSRNPHDSTRDPGGSSGGSAISIATGMSMASLGTDTRASIRVPSALSGVVGLKATYGLVPTDGVTTLSWSLDHVGPMGQTVGDTAALLGTLVGGDYSGALRKDVRGLRVGVPQSTLEGCAPEVLRAFEQAVAALRAAGVEVMLTPGPVREDFDLAVALGLIISRCEAAAYHRGYGDLHANAERYTRPVYEQLDEAGQVSAVEYLRAQRARAQVRGRVLAEMGRFDALLMPTCPVAAPPSTEVERYFLTLSQNCILWSFIGAPALSLPCGATPEGLPVGAQLVAGPHEETRLIALAAALESALG